MSLIVMIILAAALILRLERVCKAVMRRDSIEAVFQSIWVVAFLVLIGTIAIGG